MVDRVAADPAFGLTKEEIVAGLVPENFVGPCTPSRWRSSLQMCSSPSLMPTLMLWNSTLL